MAILETNNDITERKRKEAELLHKTALLDELFEGSPTRWFLMDLEARVAANQPRVRWRSSGMRQRRRPDAWLSI